ncbi:alanine dehydrogenase [Aldersonia sp. NBC_00410]|uniref:alanine dehydrogenase n=1 Tax=Aldersonia sp. NBC_00410 TaxID=2975954 RepID=UPI00225295BF|nr:alanine dehydrogenase [Aldersonia sp. NBC_00410]MCX5042647.1 alanine dehydrogenase [Aldersonia sp. NBC_00410]
MQVGVPRELKDQEYRVALTPAGAHELAVRGHRVLVETGAGAGSSFGDADYVAAGATIVDSVDELWAAAELILKVKEPIAAEYPRMRRGQVLFTYLHLAASRDCTDAILTSGITAIAYETVRAADGSLPLLAPMSEIAGKLATQVGAYHLMAFGGGAGVLMGGVPGVRPADVVVIGGGVAGTSAAAVAVGMGARVSVLDRSITRLRQLDAQFGARLTTVMSNTYEIEHAVGTADVVIGCVLVPGAKAPRLVTNRMVTQMRPGSVLVDVAIDQGGCFADSRPTTHAAPTYRVANSLFYCVANMPAAVPHTSTHALTNATLPYVLALAEHGWRAACEADPALAAGVNADDGTLLSPEVAAAFA